KYKRANNIASFDPAKYYQPLLATPESWTGPWTRSKFEYTPYGELTPQRYSADEMNDFITYHQVDHPVPGARPTLWIQNVPADAKSRYPSAESSKCRFLECPMPKGTIRNGQYRVAIDEWDLSKQAAPNKDPYHNAGYAHLYCLEKFFDLGLIALSDQYIIKPDNREFPEGRNKMAITRDSTHMLTIVNDFLRDVRTWAQKGGRPQDWFNTSLTRALTVEHLRKQPKVRQAVRQARGGNSIDEHLGNLDHLISNKKPRKER
ncbi:hypothetical protein B0O99DRAFT_470862, partial [Bisporella sp. PMI_857]